MAWVKIDDHFADHPKVLQAGPLAMALHVRALCYSSRYMTDGFIPAAAIAQLMTGFENLIEGQYEPNVLVRAGLWETVTGGWRIHDYLEYNPSKAQILSAREADRSRKQTPKIPPESSRIPPGFHRSPSPSPSPSSSLSKERGSKKRKGPVDMNGFEILWKVHPGPKGPKWKAEEQYRKLRPPENAADLLTSQVERKQEFKSRGIFYAWEVPHLFRWIRDKRWEDELPQLPAKDEDPLDREIRRIKEGKRGSIE